MNKPVLDKSDRILIIGETEDGSRLSVRGLDRYETDVLEGTGPNPHSPFFSPDGKYLAAVGLVSPQVDTLTIIRPEISS